MSETKASTTESPRLLRGFSRGAQFGAHLRLEDDSEVEGFYEEDEEEQEEEQEEELHTADDDVPSGLKHRKNNSSSAILGQFHEDSVTDSASDRDKASPATVESVVWSIDQSLAVNGKTNGSFTKRGEKALGVTSSPSPRYGSSDVLAPKKKRSALRSLLCCVREPKTVTSPPRTKAPLLTASHTNHLNRVPTTLSVTESRRQHAKHRPADLDDSLVMPPQLEVDKGKACLVLDLDETLVHSSFKAVPSPDYIIPIEIEGKVCDCYVQKRPHVDEFMAAVGKMFEVVVYTASLSKYGDPLLDLLDRSKVIRWRLFRESCTPYEGNYVKDLSRLGRDLKKTIIVDNSPHSYVFHPDNAIPIGSFIDDKEDVELLDLLKYLSMLKDVEDVTSVLTEKYG
mmetsp:Transcript_11821/g.43215  ORF Transcript_11821/g.43215 Transcript_11821/m.43215 type:complete len:397 (+) Transcript_11821:201-1391(+)